ncbi:MAG: hypothetical protein ACOY3I_04065 [Verrucomicrobiota bacterium]
MILTDIIDAIQRSAKELTLRVALQAIDSSMNKGCRYELRKKAESAFLSHQSDIAHRALKLAFKKKTPFDIFHPSQIKQPLKIRLLKCIEKGIRQGTQGGYLT